MNPLHYLRNRILALRPKRIKIITPRRTPSMAEAIAEERSLDNSLPQSLLKELR